MVLDCETRAIGVADTYGFIILEDFHDTPEAMWVWCYYTRISTEDTNQANVDMGWDYVAGNVERFTASTFLVLLKGGLEHSSCSRSPPEQ
jgi:hypothetical protein